MRIRAVFHRHLTRLTAGAIVLVMFAATFASASGPVPSPELAEQFRFAEHPLPEPSAKRAAAVREVNPSLRHIAGWISSVGAGIALNDLDDDGLPNDVCHVDPRFNSVMVSPAPGTPQRYKAFELKPDDSGDKSVAPMGCVPADLNEDGRKDVLVYYWGRPPVAFLKREGDETLPLSSERFVAQDVADPAERWYTNALTVADFDGDGHADIAVGNYFPDGARILDSGALNVENMQHSMSRAYNGGTNRILLWRGASSGGHPAVSFENVPGVFDGAEANGWTLGLGAADLDGDLLPELYVANDFGPDRLFHNRSTPGNVRFVSVEGKDSFATPASNVLGRDSFRGMGAEFADLNGDGLLDIFVSNIADDYALLENHFAFVNTGETQLLKRGVAPFVNKSEELGVARSSWAWDAKAADLNNDGYPELLQAIGFMKGSVNRWPELQELAMGNDDLLRHPLAWPRFQLGDDLSGHDPSRFYAGTRDGFVDLTASSFFAVPRVARGIAVADVDGDGRQDVAVANQWEPSYFYRNESPASNRYLGLHLMLPAGEGGQSARTRVTPGHPGPGMALTPAVTAEVKVYAPDGRIYVGQVDGGNGHSGKRSHDVFFGLGDLPSDRELTVEINWRDRGGRVHRETLSLAPGWHTVVLASGPERSDET